MAANTAKAKKRKRTSFFATVIVLLLLLLAGLQLRQIRQQLDLARAEQSALSEQVAKQRQENKSIEAALERAEDPQYLQELARDQLGMVSPGQRDFYDVAH